MPSAKKYLAGDSTFQQQLAAFNRSKKDYKSQYKRKRGVIKRDYHETERGMQEQAGEDRTDQANDFAGRGILRSGVYAKALGDYNEDFQTKVKNLLTGRNDALGDLAMQKTNFFRQLELERLAAKQDALRRRAQQFGL